MSGTNSIRSAVQQLGRSETGRQAMTELLAFLDGAALSLDQSNKEAALTLLCSAWDDLPDQVRSMMRDAVR